MDPRLFFVHIMKTGGSTFTRHLEVQLGAHRLYPNDADDQDPFTAKTSVRHLRNLPEERWDRVDALTVHMPFFVSTLISWAFSWSSATNLLLTFAVIVASAATAWVRSIGPFSPAVP